MRERKYRAWDKVAKKFLKPWPEGFGLLGETTCFDLIGMQLKERNPEKTTLEMLGDVEITEYIGRKDEGGTDVYEGDVVKILAGDYEGETAHIEYCDRCCVGYRLIYKGIGNTERFWYNEKIEVIGNIHENPELVK